MNYFLLAAVGSLAFQLHAALNPFKGKKKITDISQTSVTTIAHTYKPCSIKELTKLVKRANKPISIAGGRFSQGGHIAYPGGIVIDMTGIDRIRHFDRTHKEITVEAGITWRAIQEYIAPYGCAIKVMQSYNNFTIGGSLSVNVHGRDIHYGPLIETIKSIQVLLADGTIVTASRSENAELFSGAIGGYGALGIIVQATITLTEDCNLIQEVKQMPVDEYSAFFFKQILTHPNAVLHNANLYPPDFTIASSVTWYKTNRPATINEQVQSTQDYYFMHMLGEQLIRRIPALHKLRPSLDSKVMDTPTIVKRNYEMSTSVRTLEPLLRIPTTTVLQEYFVPTDKLMPFIERVRALTQLHAINIINISIRYVPQNTESLLSYATKDSFSLVFYINILNTNSGLAYAQIWTQELIDSALMLGGTYYLPYQLFGSLKQFHKAYPRLHEFIALKHKYDPTNKFMNNFLKKYLFI